MESTTLSGGEILKNKAVLSALHMHTHAWPPCLTAAGVCGNQDWEMGENIALEEQGSILLKFTANLNLMGHSLSMCYSLWCCWIPKNRAEASLTSQVLVGRWTGLSDKRSQCQKAKGMTPYRVKHIFCQKISQKELFTMRICWDFVQIRNTGWDFIRGKSCLLWPQMKQLLFLLYCTFGNSFLDILLL